MNPQSVHRMVQASNLLLLVAMLGMPAEAGWTRKTDMPTARSGLAACVVDGKVYAIGGGPASQVALSTVEQYDPATDTWTKKADMLAPRAFFDVGVVNGIIYALGGLTAAGGSVVSTVEAYDPATDTWTARAPMPTPRVFLSCGVANGKIYAIGGLRSGSTVGSVDVEEYDPATDTWTRKADVPRGRCAGCCATVNGVVYFIGGFYTGGTGVDQSVTTVEAYDPATASWTTKAAMHTARGSFATSVVYGKIYAIGGAANAYNSSELATVEAYDPTTDTWSPMPSMQVKRKALASAVVNGKIYAIGGVSNAGWALPLASVEEYEPHPLVVDFNSDGIVDIKDLVRMIESWGQADLTVDIGPRPFGDGVVDSNDLEILMSHWGEEPGLIAKWKLDETEGVVAFDSAGTADGVLAGNPAWQPTGGKVGGAVQLDGVDDCVMTEFVCDPSGGSFSVFAWIKGGAPGQVILSQAGGTNWLATSSTDGALMTDLKSSGRQSKTLASTALVTDNTWHRVGLSWDGETRILCVDGVEVGRDTQVNLAGSTDGLHIGVGSTLGPGTFWSGLIDDVRIYNRALLP